MHTCLHLWSDEACSLDVLNFTPTSQLADRARFALSVLHGSLDESAVNDVVEALNDDRISSNHEITAIVKQAVSLRQLNIAELIFVRARGHKEANTMCESLPCLHEPPSARSCLSCRRRSAIELSDHCSLLNSLAQMPCWGDRSTSLKSSSQTRLYNWLH